MYIVLEKSFYLSVACVLPELSCGISICLLKHVVLFITFARNMISEVIHKPNIGNAPAAIYEYTATVMCWGSWQTMAAWYTLTAKGVTLYHAVMVYHGSMVIDVFPYCIPRCIPPLDTIQSNLYHLLFISLVSFQSPIYPPPYHPF